MKIVVTGIDCIDISDMSKQDRIRLAIELMKDFTATETAFVLNDVLYPAQMTELFEMDFSKLDYNNYFKKNEK